MTPPEYCNSTAAAEMLEVSYPSFMRKHSKQIESIQLHPRGPLLFLEADVKAYREKLNTPKTVVA